MLITVLGYLITFEHIQLSAVTYGENFIKECFDCHIVFEGRFFLDIGRFEHLRSANPRLTALPVLRNLILYQTI